MPPLDPDPISVTVTVAVPPDRAWEAFTRPEAVVRWNFASDDWHCPQAGSDLRVGGRFSYRMEARDGSFGFDFEGTFTEVVPHQRLSFVLGDAVADTEGDARRVTVLFVGGDGHTEVRETFTPESTHPLEMQRAGWQAILDNYRRHAESLG